MMRRTSAATAWAALEVARREGAATVGGTVELDRGVLTRRMDLDLDFISNLLAPVDLTTTRDDLVSQETQAE